MVHPLSHEVGSWKNVVSLTEETTWKLKISRSKNNHRGLEDIKGKIKQSLSSKFGLEFGHYVFECLTQSNKLNNPIISHAILLYKAMCTQCLQWSPDYNL